MAPPKTRTSHVFRVYQTDDSGNVADDSVWLDLARIDKLPLETRGQSAHDGQLVNYVLHWGDDLTLHDRQYTKLTVNQPDHGGANVTFSIIKQMKLVGESDRAVQGQVTAYVYKNMPDSETPTARKVKSVRVINNDLNNEITMPDVTVGQPPPGTKKGAQIDWIAYQHALQGGTTDDSQFVDVEVIDTLRLSLAGAPDGTQGQVVTFVLAGNKVIENLFKPSPQDAASHGDIYRLDPFQAIVNVSWGGLAVEFLDGAN